MWVESGHKRSIAAVLYHRRLGMIVGGTLKKSFVGFVRFLLVSWGYDWILRSFARFSTWSTRENEVKWSKSRDNRKYSISSRLSYSIRSVIDGKFRGVSHLGGDFVAISMFRGGRWCRFPLTSRTVQFSLPVDKKYHTMHGNRIEQRLMAVVGNCYASEACMVPM